ncbi:hypothetical protein [Rhizobium sp. BK661]|uniref:hypothetical protein n=1 Tax=Rhizobium sp. BK661 TaxID=2586991 RepID=UPI002167D70B|nr:hypothetical protein [Rhizobium sp. BK661]MCS3741821.1 hypothetical protein [Rhizobium sp. BK661]
MTKPVSSLPEADSDDADRFGHERKERVESATSERNSGAESPCGKRKMAPAAASLPYASPILIAPATNSLIVLFYAHFTPVISSPDYSAAPSLWREMDNFALRSSYANAGKKLLLNRHKMRRQKGMLNEAYIKKNPAVLPGSSEVRL